MLVREVEFAQNTAGQFGTNKMMFHVYLVQSWDEFPGCTGGSRWPLYLHCLIWVALEEAAGAAAGGAGGHGVGTSDLPGSTLVKMDQRQGLCGQGLIC